MSHSNSSLNCFANCMKKYEHNYVLHTPPCKPVSPDLTFGTMAHEVLYKAGKLRDDSYDGVLTEDDYFTVIPSEILYNDLKNYFEIRSWDSYFRAVIKQCAEYEKELQLEIVKSGKCEIQREVKLSLTPEELRLAGYTNIEQNLVGIIDLLLLGNNCATIVDYKFSKNRKTQDDFDMNSQLPLYAFFVNRLYGIPIRNIKVAYIDISKKDFENPKVLSNGTLSRAKSQNVSQENYKRAVENLHGDSLYYNCEPGGYYYECYMSLANTKIAYLSVQYIDEDMYKGVMKDLMDTAKMIDFMKSNNMTFLKKYDSYTCKNCEYIDACKPWTVIEGE